MSNKRFHDTKGEVMGLQNRSNQTDHSHAPKWILFGIACAVILCFAAIAAGLVINDDGTGPKATEVFSSWIDFFMGDDGQEDEDAGSTDGMQGAFPDLQINVRSSDLVYEPEDQSYVIRKHFSENGMQYENDGLVCVYSDESGGHTAKLVEREVWQFSVMDGVLYYTAWDEEAFGWSLYQRELSEGAIIRECLPEEHKGTASFNFSCYEGKIYYIRIAEELALFCYDPESQSNSRVRGIAPDTYVYDIWEHTFFNVDLEEGTLWVKEPGERTSKEVELPGLTGDLWEVRICPYQGRDYLSAIEGTIEYEGSMSGSVLVNPRLCVYTLGDDELKPVISFDLWSLDCIKDWQYRDGCFYFPSTDAYSIHVFELGEYLTGEDDSGVWQGDGNESGIYPDGEEDRQPGERRLFASDEKMAEFEVTERFVYAHLYEERDLIRVYDRLTGELVEEIDCLAE
mgnify:FL=1